MKRQVPERGVEFILLVVHDKETNFFLSLASSAHVISSLPFTAHIQSKM